MQIAHLRHKEAKNGTPLLGGIKIPKTYGGPRAPYHLPQKVQT